MSKHELPYGTGCNPSSISVSTMNSTARSTPLPCFQLTLPPALSVATSPHTANFPVDSDSDSAASLTCRLTTTSWLYIRAMLTSVVVALSWISEMSPQGSFRCGPHAGRHAMLA